MLHQSEIFPKIIEIENTLEILDFTIPQTDILLWPFLRYQFMMKCQNAFFSGKFDFSYVDKGITRLTHEELLEKTQWQGIKPWPQKDIYFFSEVGTEYYKFFNGGLYDHFNEPFAELFPEKTALIDASRGPELITQTRAYPIQRAGPIKMLAEHMANQLPHKKYVPVARKIVHFLRKRIRKCLRADFTEQYYIELMHRAIFLCKVVEAEYIMFKKSFDMKMPKLIFVQDALYGKYGHLISLCKEHGACVVEMQHGLVNNEHIAYNWANTLCTDARVKNQTPDLYLLFGKYWENFVTIPGECYVIGNPWFTMQKERLGNINKNAILLLLSREFDFFLSIVELIRKVYPDREIILRPHPKEREAFLEHPLSKLAYIVADTQPDIYDSLAQCDTVCGFFSTALYEAVALGKRTFVMKDVYTEQFPQKYFTFFTTPQELIEKMQQPWVMADDAQEIFFSCQWKENYRKFVANILNSM